MAKTIKDLQDVIADLMAAVNTEKEQDKQAVNTLNLLTVVALSVSIGNASAQPGTTVTIPVSFKSGPSHVSSIQFDITPPTGVTIKAITPGQAAINAGKSAQGNPVQDGFRIIIFGLNQTPIGSGDLVNLQMEIGPSVSGKQPLQISGLSSSDPQGNSINLTGRDGSITVN